MSVNADKALGSSNSSKAFVTALVANVGILVIEVGAFVYLKNKVQEIYQPRTFLVPEDKKVPTLPGGWWRWFPAIILTDPSEILKKNGMDAYMFIRFLLLLMKMFAPITLLSCVVLFPVDAAQRKGENVNPDRLSHIQWGNIAPSERSRYWAHLIITYLNTAWILYLIRREMWNMVQKRHKFLTDPSHVRHAQAKTVLITSLPHDLTNEHALRQFASFVPGGIEKIWVYRDVEGLIDLYNDRLKICGKLEKAESNYLRAALKAWRKQQKVGKKTGGTTDVEAAGSPGATALALVPRLTHRLGWVPFFGEKVDTINWCKDEIVRLNNSIEEARKDLDKAEPHGSAFIQCKEQIGAHVLAQCIAHHEPLTMADRWIEVAADDIIWDNIDDGAYETRARKVISRFLTIALIVLWFFPSSFIGLLSNVDGLCIKVPWLAWVCKLNTVVQGIVQGVLPPVLLAIFFLILPIILRALAVYECIPRQSLVDISLYKRYYAFLVVHGFLVVTISSGLTQALPAILKNPTNAIQELSSRLPLASIFFLTYVLTAGLSGAGSALLQAAPLIIRFIKKWLFGSTPRQAYGVTFLMPKVEFGQTLPRISLLATIAVAYSTIAPLICGLALISFSLLWMTWKFLLLWVMDQPDAQETGGLYFPLIVSNIYVGLYIEQIALATLFFIAQDAQGRQASIPQGALMILLLLITVASQMLLHNSFDPLVKYLPMSIATEKVANRYAKRKAPAAGTEPGTKDDVLDLFNPERMKSVLRRRLLTSKKRRHAYELGDVHEHEKTQGQSHHSKEGEKHEDEGQENQFDPASLKYPSNQTHGHEGEASTSGAYLKHQSSHASLASKASSTKPEKAKKIHGIVIAPAAPALKRPQESEDADEAEDQLDDHAFDHPSTYKDAPWIWIPEDKLGMSKILIQDLVDAKVDADSRFAEINEKGEVSVRGGPPEEEWSGGHDI